MVFRIIVLFFLVLSLSSCAFNGQNNSGDLFFVLKTKNNFIARSKNSVHSDSEYLKSIKSYRLLDKLQMSDDLFVWVAITPTILDLWGGTYLKENFEKELLANEGVDRYWRNKIHLN